MGLCQNGSETTESIKEAKAICVHSTQEAETLCSTTIKEAKATLACFIQEAETLCSTAIREAETQGASQAASLHRSHAKSIQCLEKQAIKEESKSQLDFLSTCEATVKHQRPTHLVFHKKLPPLCKCQPPWILPLLCLSVHLDPSGTIPLQTRWMSQWDHIQGNLRRAP